MSNTALHSSTKFDPDRHFLRRDVQFLPPGAHILIKWTKTLQDNKSYHIIQLPFLDNIYLCPVRALQALLRSRDLPPSAPLFATIHYPHIQFIDTHIRDALRKILQLRNILPTGHGFHTFRRSGATFAFVHSEHNDPWLMEKFRSMDLLTKCIPRSLHHTTHLCLLHPSFFLIGFGGFKIPCLLVNNFK